MLTLLKFSTQDCPACESMAAIDSQVATDMGLAFVNVDMRDPETYRHYRQVLLRRHPSKNMLALPSYFLVSDPEGDAEIYGEVIGSMAEQEFRSMLLELMAAAPAAGSWAVPAGQGDSVASSQS